MSGFDQFLGSFLFVPLRGFPISLAGRIRTDLRPGNLGLWFLAACHSRYAGPQGFNGQYRQDLSLVAVLDLGTCRLTLRFCTVKFLSGPSTAP